MTSPLTLSHHVLDDACRDLIGKEVEARLASSRLTPDADGAILAGIGAFALRQHLPERVRRAVDTFTDAAYHAIVLSNLPTHELPPTPVSGFGDETALAVSNAVQLGLIRLMGLTPFAVPYENEGRLMRNIVPNPEVTATASSWGADSEFFWHTDNPHLPFGSAGQDPRPHVPRFLTLLGLRNEEAVPTELTSVERAVAALDEPTRHALCGNDFEVGAPNSNDDVDGGGRLALAGTAVLERATDGYLARYDRDSTRGLTPAAQAALAGWEGVLGRLPAFTPVLWPGTFIAFDNYRTLHRRSEFTPAAPAQARWLRRCYAS